MAVFTYTQCPGDTSAAFPDGRTALRPILPISIINGEHRFSCYAIVDSGADYCTFPGVFMDALQIDRSAAKPDSNFRGVTPQSTDIFFHEVMIDLAFTLPYPVYVGFSDSMNEGYGEAGLGLLGQVGFFDRFKVVFDWSNKLFEIQD